MGHNDVVTRHRPGHSHPHAARLDPQAQEFRPSLSHSHPMPPPPPAALSVPFFGSPPPPPLPVYYPYATTPSPYVSHSVPAPPPPAPFAAPPPLLPPAGTATRAIFLSSVPPDVSESVLRTDMEAFGEVRAVQMERLAHDGTATVHFFDLRHARRALWEIREKHMWHQCLVRDHHRGAPAASKPPGSPHGLVAGRVVWAQFIIPAANAIPEGQNQGTIVIFNLDADVTPDHLRHIFEAFGPVKELRDTPYKKHQRFVEFYDVRDAATALREMDGKEINGRNVIIEFSRPGGYSRKFLNSAGAYVTTVSKTMGQPPLPPPPQSRLPHHMMLSTAVVPLENSVHRLSLRFGNGNESEVMDSSVQHGPVLKKSGSGKKKHGKATKQQQSHDIKPWKSRQGRKLDSRFVISNDAFVESSDSRDPRTTVMIKNIPNKYSQKLLLNMLDTHCINCNKQIGDEDSSGQPLSSYDFVYLPIDFNNKCNVGYGFVNMTSPEAALRLYEAFHLRHWEVFNSRKICEVSYARIQGLEALKEHFKNSKFPCELDHYLPVVFSPPRDGRCLTEPIPVIGQGSPSKVPHMKIIESGAVDGDMDSQEGLEEHCHGDNEVADCDKGQEVEHGHVDKDGQQPLSRDGADDGVKGE